MSVRISALSRRCRAFTADGVGSIDSRFVPQARVPPEATLLENAWLLDAERPLEQADMLVQDGAIAAIGHQLDRTSQVKRVDASGHLVLPGLVNAHTHSNQALERGLADNLPLDSWMVLASYGGAGACLNADDLYVATAFGALEMLRSGCTAVVDMARVDQGPHFETQADAVVRAYRDVGLRAAVALQYSDLDFFDSLPLHLVDSRPPLPSSPPGALDAILANVETWARRLQTDADPTIVPMLGPSSVGRCSDALFERSADLAARLDIGLQTHLLSARSQVPLARQRFGKRTVERLAEIGCLGERVSFAHAIWPDTVEIGLLAESGSAVVSNPVSNQKLGAGIAPLQAMRDAGVRLALGTDGASSNDCQDMWATLKAAAVLHKTYGPAESWVSARDALRWCWEGGARVLRLPVGRLEVGALADLTLLRLDRLLRLPTEHMRNQLVYASPGSAVDSVFVHGRLVLDGGRVVGVDEDSIWRAAQKIVDRLYGAMGARLETFAAAQPAMQALERAVRALPLEIERSAHVH
jgi:5-methylthioadenosine/S-adenosylhomocysteine deaminase